MNLEQLTIEVNNIFYNDSSSYKTIQSIQKELLTVLSPSLDIKNIDYKSVLKYFNYLKNQNYKASTINNKMMYLSKILNYALKTNKIKHKPLILTVKNKNKKLTTLTETDYNKMLDYCSTQNKKELYQVIVIGYNTGMRISNILNITLDNIDNNYIRIWENKTDTPYSIPLNVTLIKFFKDFQPFTMNYRQIQYQFETMKKDLNLDKNITIHTLRHTTCSTLIEKGVPLPVVQKVMNHKNISTTLLYTHLKNEQLEQAVSML